MDQAKDIRSHDQEVAQASRGWVPVGVRRAAGDQNGGASAGLDFSFAGLDDESAFEDVPGFVVGVVHVTRSDQPRRASGGAGILPLGDDEGVVERD